MKAIIASILIFIASSNVFAKERIANWDAQSNLSEAKAFDLIFDFYIYSVWWEDEGYECGGKFSNLELTSASGSTYTVQGNVTVVQNYCAYESTASFVVELRKVGDEYEVFEIVWND